MKKQLLFLMSIITLLSYCFTSCEKTSGDILKGTWEYVPGYNSSGGVELTMTYIFDGKGNYTFTVKDYEKRTTKGTYVIKDEKYVHTYYSKQNPDGTTKEYSEVLELDAHSNPPTLTGYAYDLSGNILQTLLFEKKH